MSVERGKVLAEELCAILDGEATDQAMPALWTAVIEVVCGVTGSPEAAERAILDYAKLAAPIARGRWSAVNEEKRIVH